MTTVRPIQGEVFGSHRQDSLIQQTLGNVKTREVFPERLHCRQGMLKTFRNRHNLKECMYIRRLNNPKLSSKNSNAYNR